MIRLSKILDYFKIFMKFFINFILFLPRFFSGLIILAVIFFSIRFISLDSPVDVVDGSILHIPMEGMIVEEKTEDKDIRDILFQESNTPQIDFHQLLNAIDEAKDDDKIKGIFLDLSDFLGGYPAELIKIAKST